MKLFFSTMVTLYQVFSSLFSVYVLILLSLELFGLKVFKWENFHFKPVVISMTVLVVPNLIYSLWKGLGKIKEIIK